MIRYGSPETWWYDFLFDIRDGEIYFFVIINELTICADLSATATLHVRNGV